MPPAVLEAAMPQSGTECIHNHGGEETGYRTTYALNVR